MQSCLPCSEPGCAGGEDQPAGFGGDDRFPGGRGGVFDVGELLGLLERRRLRVGDEGCPCCHERIYDFLISLEMFSGCTKTRQHVVR